MIEQDVKNYLCTVSGFASAFGKTQSYVSVSGIFIIQAKTGTLMPYVIVENSEGTRVKAGAVKTDETDFVRITVDAGPAQLYKGRNIVQVAFDALENYRGIMGGAKDVICACSPIRGWAGTGGAYRYQFTANIRHLETKNDPFEIATPFISNESYTYLVTETL